MCVLGDGLERDVEQTRSGLEQTRTRLEGKLAGGEAAGARRAEAEAALQEELHEMQRKGGGLGC